jgi:phosphatidylserine/phosphatidylglycerophosphate/cardiolipin synthase-like enzyme
MAIRRILGKQWFEKPSVSVRLLTDTPDLSCIDTETIQYFYERGEVKGLIGLHSKIYIVDDTCIITSANLTTAAFTKRREIGVILSPSESKNAIKTFSS